MLDDRSVNRGNLDVKKGWRGNFDCQQTWRQDGKISCQKRIQVFLSSKLLLFPKPPISRTKPVSWREVRMRCIMYALPHPQIVPDNVSRDARPQGLLIIFSMRSLAANVVPLLRSTWPSCSPLLASQGILLQWSPLVRATDKSSFWP